VSRVVQPLAGGAGLDEPTRIMARRPGTAARGFSLTELMLVVSVFTVMVTVAVPTTLNVNEALKLGSAVREFEREMQSARMKAVQTNRPIRVRFNCPVPGQYRRVEVMNSLLDTASDRCDQILFPSTRDGDPATPAYDGPLHYMPEGVMLVSDVDGVEFWPDGRAFQVTSGAVQPIVADGLRLMVSKGTHYTSVAVNGLGRVDIQ
jgi:prepilin-type N-terminal cleavage/methylation domain-containing protein